jgi:hypothetical protein
MARMQVKSAVHTAALSLKSRSYAFVRFPFIFCLRSLSVDCVLGSYSAIASAHSTRGRAACGKINVFAGRPVLRAIREGGNRDCWREVFLSAARPRRGVRKTGRPTAPTTTRGGRLFAVFED